MTRNAGESVVRTVVRRNAYADSITLLQVTSLVAAEPGVADAALVMATELNRDVLRQTGLLTDEAAAAGPNDLVIAVRAVDEAAAYGALVFAEGTLQQRRRPPGGAGERPSPPRTLRRARQEEPEATIALISVPGPYAAAEARQALLAGLHVFLFSDNVPLEDEIELKQRGQAAGLLVMGPDCGTAILHGVGLGFANVVRGGSIGLIGASGTGLQEVSCLLDRAGLGISHAIGTGGRDLDARVGGLTTLHALDLLRDDPATEQIVLLSKPAAPAVAERVLGAAAATGKPVIACLLGAERMAAPPGVRLARTLDEAARLAAGGAEGSAVVADGDVPLLSPPLDGSQRQVRGLFCGGSLCQEAALLLGETIEHQVTDFGADEYTRGRAHPMIDPSLRNQAILEAASDRRVAVLLLDVILGYGAHPDPAGAVAPTVREAQRRAAADGRGLAILAHVVGTPGDPQHLEQQEATLRGLGVHLCGSNAQMARTAGRLLARGGV